MSFVLTGLCGSCICLRYVPILQVHCVIILSCTSHISVVKMCAIVRTSPSKHDLDGMVKSCKLWHRSFAFGRVLILDALCAPARERGCERKNSTCVS